MKALGISGSPRVDGNTMMITRHALNAMAEEGIETGSCCFSGLPSIRGCNSCLSPTRKRRALYHRRRPRARVREDEVR